MNPLEYIRALATSREEVATLKAALADERRRRVDAELEGERLREGVGRVDPPPKPRWPTDDGRTLAEVQRDGLLRDIKAVRDELDQERALSDRLFTALSEVSFAYPGYDNQASAALQAYEDARGIDQDRGWRRMGADPLP